MNAYINKETQTICRYISTRFGEYLLYVPIDGKPERVECTGASDRLPSESFVLDEVERSDDDHFQRALSHAKIANHSATTRISLRSQVLPPGFQNELVLRLHKIVALCPELQIQTSNRADEVVFETTKAELRIERFDDKKWYYSANGRTQWVDTFDGGNSGRLIKSLSIGDNTLALAIRLAFMSFQHEKSAVEVLDTAKELEDFSELAGSQFQFADWFPFIEGMIEKRNELGLGTPKSMLEQALVRNRAPISFAI